MSTTNQANPARRSFLARGKKPLNHRQMAQSLEAQIKAFKDQGGIIQPLPPMVSPRRPNVGYDDGYECGTAVDGIW